MSVSLRKADADAHGKDKEEKGKDKDKDAVPVDVRDADELGRLNYTFKLPNKGEDDETYEESTWTARTNNKSTKKPGHHCRTKK